jgi:8-oxo-dGTP pyrophosphatase MutT (NUDIX family)
MFKVSIKGVLAAPDGRVILLQNERDEWELPGGQIELNESPARAWPARFTKSFAFGSKLDSH